MRSGISPVALHGKAAEFVWTKCCLPKSWGKQPVFTAALFLVVIPLGVTNPFFGHRTVEPDFADGISLSFSRVRKRLRTIHLLQQDAGECKVEIEGDRGGRFLSASKGRDAWCASCIAKQGRSLEDQPSPRFLFVASRCQNDYSLSLPGGFSLQASEEIEHLHVRTTPRDTRHTTCT